MKASKCKMCNFNRIASNSLQVIQSAYVHEINYRPLYISVYQVPSISIIQFKS